MRKISLVLVISASFIVGTLVAGNLVFAAPADSQNELLSAILQEVQALTGLVEGSGPETVPLQPVAGRNLEFVAANSGVSLLYYGEELCQINPQNGALTNAIYIEFAGTTTVLHQGECPSSSFKINLVGNQDAVFQPGDFLILEDQNELFRQQTP